MHIDWDIVEKIGYPIILLFIGGYVTRLFENRAALVSYFSHISSFQYTGGTGQALRINSHSVVLKNAGRKSADNIRLQHLNLPDFYIWPTVSYTVDTMPNGTRDIVIPVLVPGEEITISYLYPHPTTVSQVNAGIKYDQGFAKQINVLLQRQYPKWFSFIVALLMIVGLITTIYLVCIGVAKEFLS